MKDILAPLQTYFSLMETNGMAYVFRISSEVGIFDCLAEGAKTTSQISNDLQTLTYPTELLCLALVEMDVLKKEKDQFELTPVMHFLKGNYQNLSSEYWEHFPTFLKTGQPFKKMDTISDSEKEYQTQVKALEWMMAPCAQMAAKHLQELGLKGEINVLDVGCGSAVWSLSILAKNPKAQATLADWPAVLNVAKDSANTQKLIDRIQFIEGNYHETSFGKQEHDVAILGNVTHIETKEGCKKLFTKIANSLRPGGVLVIHDVYGEDPRGAMARRLYRLGLAVRTVQGKVHDPDEMRPWLEESGFSQIEFKSLDTIPYSMGSVYAWKS